MERPKVKIYYLLMPLAMLYGMVVFIRNKLFDWRVLKSQSFPLPVICIGNLAVGGTGKTPHTEYVARLLKDRVRTAVLSRGYGRRTRGFASSWPWTRAAVTALPACWQPRTSPGQ